MVDVIRPDDVNRCLLETLRELFDIPENVQSLSLHLEMGLLPLLKVVTQIDKTKNITYHHYRISKVCDE